MKTKKYIFIVLLLTLFITGCSGDTGNITEDGLLHGNLLDFNENCLDYDDSYNCKNNVAIIKAKIESSYSNKTTIDQNYFNIEDFIKNKNGNKYDEIQYWAVADMTSGDESKVISFTIKKDLINDIYNSKYVANELGNYVDDLWIHPSLN